MAPTDVAARLDRLERAANLWRWTSVALAASICALFLLARQASHQEEVRARKFIVVDAEGRPRGGLEAGEDGMARLFLLDAEANSRITLQARAQGGEVISLLDADGTSHVVLGVSHDAIAYLVMCDPQGTCRSELNVDTLGNGGISFDDAKRGERGGPRNHRRDRPPSRDAGSHAHRRDRGALRCRGQAELERARGEMTQRGRWRSPGR